MTSSALGQQGKCPVVRRDACGSGDQLGSEVVPDLGTGSCSCWRWAGGEGLVILRGG